MFCKNCGTQIPDDSAVCSNCGTSTAPAKSAEGSFDVNALVKKVTGNKYFIPAVAGVAALLVIILLVSTLGGNAKVKPIENFFKGMVAGDAEKALSAIPEEILEYYDEEYDVDLEDYFDDSIDDLIDELEDEYGKKLKVKVKVVDKEKLDEDDLKDLADALKDDYDLSKRDVKEAWELECEIFISGKEDEDSEDLEAIVFKYQGKWYLSPTDFFGAW